MVTAEDANGANAVQEGIGDPSCPATGLQASADSKKAIHKSLVLIVLVGIGVYLNSFGGVMIFDDYYHIVENPAAHHLPGFDRLGLRFVVFFTNALNYQLDGLNPRGYHAVNLAIHIGSALLLFGLIRRTLLLPNWSEAIRAQALGIALVVALIWEVHPLQTQAITYIIQRCESMMALCYLSTLYCFLRGATSARPRLWYCGAILSGLVGVGCKEVIASVPLVILLYDRVFLSRSWRELIAQHWKIHLLLFGFILGFFAYVVGQVIVSGAESAGFTFKGFGPWQYLLTQTHVLSRYVGLSIWPKSQCFDYMGFPIIGSLRDAILPGSFLAAALAASIYGVLRRRWWGFLGTTFFLILAPTSSIMPIQDVCVEHRMYLPLASIVILLVAFFFAGSRWLANKRSLGAGTLSRIQVSLAVVAILVYGFMTLLRNEAYRSPVFLWGDVVEKRPMNYRGQDSLGVALNGIGLQEKGEEHALRCLQLNPNYAEGENNLAVLLVDKNRLPEALERFSLATKLQPSNGTYERNVGMVLLLQEKPAEAIPHLQASGQLRPNDSLTWLLLAFAYMETDHPNSARVAAEQGLRMDPSSPNRMLHQARHYVYVDKANPAQKRAGLMYSRLGCFITKEQNIDLLDTLAFAYAQSGQFSEAIATLSKAVELAETAGDSERTQLFRNRLKIYANKQVLKPGQSG